MVDQLPGVALITGAATGIGAVYADRLAHRGHDLLLVGLDPARMESLAARLRSETGRSVEVLATDLTDRVELAKVERRLTTDPAITILVNNAGMSLNGGLLASTHDQVQRLIALNVTAPTVLAAAAARAFRKKRSGAIVNLASTSALAPEFVDATYAASKGFLLNLSLKLAAELRADGVRVQAVLPGAVRTGIWAGSGKDVDALFPGRVMEVDDLVDAALVGFDRNEVVTIPPLAEESLWMAYESARLALAPHLTQREVAPRYSRALAGLSTPPLNAPVHEDLQ